MQQNYCLILHVTVHVSAWTMQLTGVGTDVGAWVGAWKQKHGDVSTIWCEILAGLVAKVEHCTYMQCHYKTHVMPVQVKLQSWFSYQDKPVQCRMTFGCIRSMCVCIDIRVRICILQHCVHMRTGH